MKVGILAFHGDFAEHEEILRKLGHTPVEVRARTDLKQLRHLIIPGGESTVLSAFLESSGLAQQIKKNVEKGELSVFGTCAGAIILSKKARGKNAPKTLRLINMVILRNAYGTQQDSFEESIRVEGIRKPVAVAFIRAPIIVKTGRSVKVLATHRKNPVVVQQGNVLAATCHPEIRGDTQLHEYFLRM